MKRIANYLIALAVAAFTFTSCSDVPAPFGEILKPAVEEGEVIEPAGSGTEADPYNVAGVLQYISGLGADTPSDKEVFIQGYVSETTDISAQYGNATFNMSDNVDGTANKFTVYRAKGLGGENVTDEKFIKEGDFVVVCGKVTNYKGNTPTEEVKTVSVADFLKAAESTSVWYQLTGTVKNLKDGDLYGNFDIEDATGSVYVYGLLSEKGGEKKKFQELVAAKGIKNGSKLTIIGNRGSYNGTTQVTNAYFVSVESGSDTPTPIAAEGDGTEANPYNVPAALAKGDQAGVYMKAFIVGYVDGQVYSSGANFSSASTTLTNVLIAASADETNPDNCMPVQLPSGDIRTALNLQDNAGNYKKEVLLYGDITKYFGVVGLKNTSYAVIDGKTIGKKPGESSGEEETIKTVTIAEFNAAAESTDVWYQLTGTVKDLKDGDQYGNFNLEDNTGSVYVYGVLSEKGGAKKLFQELVTKYGIKDGTKITIIGNRGSYKGTIQVTNAYFVKVENSSSTTGADGSTIITVADFNAAAVSTDVWYQLTGTVKDLKDGDQYGNFNLEDNTGSVYVYGVLSEKGGAKKKFQELVAAKGIKNGSTITIVGNRGEYKGNIQVTNAYFVSAK